MLKKQKQNMIIPAYFFSKKKHSISLSNEQKQMREQLSDFANEKGTPTISLRALEVDF